MNHRIIGIILTLISTLTYAVQTALIKGLGNSISVSIPMLVFIQSIVCFVLIVPVLGMQGREQALQLIKTKNIKMQLLRTLFSLGISYFLFSAIQFIPLVDAVLLVNTAPLMIPLLGLLFMSQKINHRLWLPLLIGFAGVALILKPNGEVFKLASLLGLAAGLCLASSVLSLRQASKTDAALTNAFYYFLLSLPISALIAVFFWNPVSGHELLALVVVGVLFFIVQITLIYATKFVSAQTIASLYLINIVFAAFISWMVWHLALTLSMTLGIILTLAGAILTIQAQNVKKYQPAAIHD